MEQNQHPPATGPGGPRASSRINQREISATSFTGSLVRVGMLPVVLIVLFCAGLAAWSIISLVTPVIDEGANLFVNEFDVHVPEITIADGKASMRGKQPYFIDVGETKENVALVIDTREGKQNDALKYLKGANTGFVLGRDSLYSKNESGQIRILPLKQVPDMVINSENLRWFKDTYLPLVMSGLVALIIVYFLLAKPFQAALLALIPYAIVRHYSVALSYGQAFKISVFCMIPPVVLEAAMDFLGIHIPGGFFVYFGIYLALLVGASMDLMRPPGDQSYPTEQIGP